jgi:hypothetical protein
MTEEISLPTSVLLLGRLPPYLSLTLNKSMFCILEPDPKLAGTGFLFIDMHETAKVVVTARTVKQITT